MKTVTKDRKIRPLTLLTQLIYWTFIFSLLGMRLVVNSEAAVTPLEKVAQKMAAQLNQQLSLGGRVIQVSENGFWQRRTRVKLPFSSAMRDVMANALAGHGAKISLQEIGEEPLILTGVYAREGANVAITLEIRHMGSEASKALAVVQTNLRWKDVDPNWFRPEFSRIARTLVCLLEEHYHGVDPLAVELPLPKPGLPGQPPLVLGRDLKKHLEEALADTSLFERASIRTRDTIPAILITTYSNIGNDYLLILQVQDREGQLLTAAQLTISGNDIPPDLLKPQAEEVIKVVVVYNDDLAKVPATTTASQTLLAKIQEGLSAHGLPVKMAGKEASPYEADIKVEVAIVEAGKSRTNNGLTAFQGTAQLRVLELNDGRVLATITRSDKLTGPGGRSDTFSRLAENLGNSMSEELVSSILGR
ncbi:MAG: hypothetical protein LWX01_07550 [Deltaproteobacteria bacterium]|nr:hypothetical protein [Deltaproteobacteria bacterium]MDL1961539.1 hypothetical protein [Deltaproteobacteria bacterium]